jgi:DDE superfamily endonuclease
MVFVDDPGCSCRAQTGTTWAPRGHTPLLRRVSTRRELAPVIALPLSGKIYTRHVEHAMGATEMLIALKPFQRLIARPMIVVWDRFNAPRAVIVQDDVAAHPGMAVAWLPPYAPDLHPEEGCPGHSTQHRRHAVPATLHDLRIQVARGFARVGRRPDLIRGFFRHAGLSVNLFC